MGFVSGSPDTVLQPRRSAFLDRIVVPDFIWSFKLYEMLFRLRSELFSSVISTALAYPMSGVCNTTKRERNGNH